MAGFCWGEVCWPEAAAAARELRGLWDGEVPALGSGGAVGVTEAGCLVLPREVSVH